MVQDFLTHAIEFIAIAHLTLSLVNAMSRRRKPSPGQLSLLDEQLQPIWEEYSADGGRWLDELQQVESIAIPDGVFCCDADPVDASLVNAYIQNRRVQATHNVVPFIRSTKRTAQAIDWNAFTPYQLRSECQKRSIRWRNAHGKNRHMTKAQMVEALNQTAAA